MSIAPPIAVNIGHATSLSHKGETKHQGCDLSRREGALMGRRMPNSRVAPEAPR
jgi:hypothetical protein